MATYLGNRGTKTGTTGLDGIATISPASIVRAGDLLVMTVAALAGIFPANINDTQGNEWQVDASLLNTSRVSICSSVLAFELQPADVINLNLGVSLIYDLDLEEFSGVVSPAWKDVTKTNSGAGTALDSGTTPVASQGPIVDVAAFAINAAEAAFTPDAAYSAFGIVSQAGLGLLGEYQIELGAPNTHHAVGTAGTTGTWAGAIATYKAGTAQDEMRGPDPFMTR